MQLSLIIPIYRQEKTIVHNIKHILETLEKTRFSYEVICVVDGFVDQSYALLEEAQLPHVQLLGYEKNHGKSYAIRYGMKHATGDYVMFLDAGMEIDTSGISMLMEHMTWYEADIIVGSKRHPVSKVTYTPIRRFLSLGYYYLVKLLFGLDIRDTQAGIKVFRHTVLEKVLPRLVEKKFCGDLEMLVAAKAQGFDRIYEAPIKLNYQFASVTTARSMNSIRGMLVDTAAIWYRRYLIRHYTTKIAN
jgi:glycosyltransferase involved in cell wall biosynthesis